MPEPDSFTHENLDVFQASIEFVALANQLTPLLPEGRSYLADQLNRACSSIPLNIAEGAGEFSPKEKARFYRMAKRSATECAAILSVCAGLGLEDRGELERGRRVLLRVVSMLTGIVKRWEAEQVRGGTAGDQRG